MHPELEALAKKVIDENKYMVLGTAGQDGRPWVSPVYYTPDGYTDFYWVSSPDSLHSRNIAQRPEISIVVFNSQVPIGGAQAVYMSAVAGPVPEDELERRTAFYSGRFPELREFPPEDLRPPALFRLYRATATEHSVLIRGSDPTYGRGVDSRMTVTLSRRSGSLPAAANQVDPAGEDEGTEGGE
ncbi:MAG: pyridoxamine 5'-phosphate oxidase family protein [Propionibacteriales bacterium]|nr:pyridoxamine 5'-phosphate oxidase family protein [Propionibacteriales bacterium]